MEPYLSLSGVQRMLTLQEVPLFFKEGLGEILGIFSNNFA